MKIFEKFNQGTDAVCPLCKTNAPKKIALVIKDGTQEGNLAEAIQIHLDCIELRISPETSESRSLIYQVVEK